jgi:hypothetical protein
MDEILYPGDPNPFLSITYFTFILQPGILFFTGVRLLAFVVSPLARRACASHSGYNTRLAF